MKNHETVKVYKETGTNYQITKKQVEKNVYFFTVGSP